MSYNLFLDDVRDPNDSWMSYFKAVRYPLYNWLIVRSYKDFVKVIDDLGIPEFVSYDHDLAEAHYSPSMYLDLERYEKDIIDTEPTGLECAKYLISKLNGELHPNYVVHSKNPIGRERIKNCIEDYNKNLN